MDTQNTSQHMLTKPLPWQRGHKMYINFCRPNLSHANDGTNCSSLCVEQTHHTPNTSHLNMCWPNPYMPRRTQDASQFVDKTHPMPARIQNVCQLVLIKPILCQEILKMLLNMCWPNPSYASVKIKFILTRVEDKMHLNMCWPNSTNAIHVTKCISNRVVQKQPMPART